jgi:hypothetical protein
MGNSAFVAKFDASGKLVYQRTLDGYPTTISRAIAVDAAGNAYITGQTLSRDFPLLKALQPNPGGVSCHATPLTSAEMVTTSDWELPPTLKETPMLWGKPALRIFRWPILYGPLTWVALLNLWELAMEMMDLLPNSIQMAQPCCTPLFSLVTAASRSILRATLTWATRD